MMMMIHRSQRVDDYDYDETHYDDDDDNNNEVKCYCIVLYCIVLYCIVLYCIVLYCIVLYCMVMATTMTSMCHNHCKPNEVYNNI